MKPEYFGRKELYDVINYTRIFVFVQLVNFTICGLAYNIFYIYPAVEKRKTYEHEALFCSVEIGIYFNLITGGILYLMFLLFLLVIILINIFQKLSEDLQLLKMYHPNLETELEVIMTQHNALWDYVKQFNGPFNYVLTILYSCLIAGTSLLYYVMMFLKMEFALRVFICIIIFTVSFICISVGFLPSAFTSTMQTSFQDIRRFAECDLKLEQKLKIWEGIFMFIYQRFLRCYQEVSSQDVQHSLFCVFESVKFEDRFHEEILLLLRFELKNLFFEFNFIS
ncbi:uncharacterized protein LOC111641056 isoform X1 [Centruroides sculpturatus]|uniref:uncharacterized protein LOC111641056 isoform X1 n=1 Tax=Centruroides sculpturatus TaxID=218467 RepID=UPI000C6D88D6|nr:uncharacterized protein LOC111641056 isoform X1 [Centruroides sculpturatus]